MKCLMLGAGATSFCDIANKDRRPPLVNAGDFLRMIQEPLGYGMASSPFAETSLKPFFMWAFQEFSGDLERLFTLLFYISDEITYDDIELRVRQRFSHESLLEDLVKVATKLAEKRTAILPRNIIELLIGLVREEINLCLGTSGRDPKPYDFQPLSSQHRLLVKELKSGDIVISFNYDTVVDYALLNEKLLNRNSFKNPSFDEVRLPDGWIADAGHVFLFKPHGSFNWFSPLEDVSKVGIFFGKLDEGTNYSRPTPVILPYYCKEIILTAHPVYRAELEMSLESLGSCDEIVVIGKQFLAGDNDLFERIRVACGNKKHRVVYVNPAAKNVEWVKHHDAAFNSELSPIKDRWFPDLASYLSARDKRQS